MHTKIIALFYKNESSSLSPGPCSSFVRMRAPPQKFNTGYRLAENIPATGWYNNEGLTITTFQFVLPGLQ